MTHRIKRCTHCGRTYSYQGSGDGCHRPSNDKNYCPVCKRIILAVLAESSKVEFKCAWREFEVSPEVIENIILLDEQYRKWMKSNNKYYLNVHRLLFGITDSQRIVDYGFYRPDRKDNSHFEKMVEHFKKDSNGMLYTGMTSYETLVDTEKNFIRIEWGYNEERDEWDSYPWRI